MGSCGGEPPGGDGGTRNGGTGAIFQGTVTGRGARDGRIERPPEPFLLLNLVALAQQRAASQLLLAPLATVGDVPSGGKGLSKS